MLVEKITTDPAEAPRVTRGAIVRMRRARWRVVDIRPFDGGAIVTLAGPAPPRAGLVRRVLTPSDTMEPIEPTGRARILKPGPWPPPAHAAVRASPPPPSLLPAS